MRSPRDSLPRPTCRLGGWLFVHAITLAAATVSAADVESRLVVVVAADNPVSSLTRSELADLFLGRTTRFPDGRKATPIDRVEGSSERGEFYAEFLGRTTAQIKAHWSKVIFTGRGTPPRAVADDAELRRLVARDPAAIGYLERDAVDRSLKVVRIE